MKKILLALTILLILNPGLKAQTYLQKQWDHTFGGSGVERIKAIIETSDNGFLIGGHSNSDSSGDISEPIRGGNDFWVVKTNSLGDMQWNKRFGGSLEENFQNFDESSDGGFLLGGFTASDSGLDVSQPTKGSLDFWVVKTDAAGNKLWDKRYGGSDYEWMYAVEHTSDGGYLLGGHTFSNPSGDVTQPTRGGDDFWVIKIDSAGNKQWDKRYGGSQTEILYDLVQTPDGGYILGGTSSSPASGEVTQAARGENDYWVVRIDSAGNVIWDKRFGGSDFDDFHSVNLTSDGGFVLGGVTISDVSGDVSVVTRDTSLNIVNRGDIWIVKIDSAGIKQWDKRYGGSWVEDDFGYVTETNDGGFLFGSASYSGISGEKTEANFGKEQSWFLKTDSAGNKLWDKTIFNEGEEEDCFPIQSSDGCYVIANRSQGDSTAYKTQNSRGNYDYWMVKFCETSTPQLPVANFEASYPVICEGGCFTFYNQSLNAGSFHWEFPGATPSTSTATSPGNICYADTGHYTVTLVAINASGNDTLAIQNIIYVAPLPYFSITRSGDTLFAPSGYPEYQWYEDTVVLLNDTLNYLVLTQNGNYSVSVTDTNNCPWIETISILNVSVPTVVANRNSLYVYPNPTSNSIRLRGIDMKSDNILRVYDVSGRIVFYLNGVQSDKEISVENLQPGLYFLEVRSDNNTFITRLIKE